MEFKRCKRALEIKSAFGMSDKWTVSKQPPKDRRGVLGCEDFDEETLFTQFHHILHENNLNAKEMHNRANLVEGLGENKKNRQGFTNERQAKLDERLKLNQSQPNCDNSSQLNPMVKTKFKLAHQRSNSDGKLQRPLTKPNVDSANRPKASFQDSVFLTGGVPGGNYLQRPTLSSVKFSLNKTEKPRLQDTSILGNTNTDLILANKTQTDFIFDKIGTTPQDPDSKP